MKISAWILLVLHTVILFLWVMNSVYLFSFFGVVFWAILVAIGFIVQKQLNGQLLIKVSLLASSYLLIVLIGVTVGIYFVTSSMP
ncbi:hypothetical protein [Bacillus sp. es.036]|uniref:hypothetical protein n=1 Tax=Bacillus sp. es.036 TaxID=1761764 RepID=UPI000BF5EFB3|nr:hypothetical protein [Bacillus sp. es.036]PFG13220.1 hypothetical protein ATG70_1421 [Bacillus sp. es.036]